MLFGTNERKVVSIAMNYADFLHALAQMTISMIKYFEQEEKAIRPYCLLYGLSLVHHLDPSFAIRILMDALLKNILVQHISDALHALEFICHLGKQDYLLKFVSNISNSRHIS